MEQAIQSSLLQGEAHFILEELLGARPCSSTAILVDANSRKLCLHKIITASSLESAQVIEIPAGEAGKTLNSVSSVWSKLAETLADRQALLINLGGGAVCDAGGFAASAYKRGIRFFNVPTTLLAMVDAAIGGKNAINLRSLKNIAGTFAQPETVIIDPSFLATLPAAEWKNGFAEMLKQALVHSPAEWDYVSSLHFSPGSIDGESILRSASIKLEITRRDPFDHAIRKSLNFGHTVGHAVESWHLEKKIPLSHGEAVAAGMAVELHLSHLIAGFSSGELNQVLPVIINLFPPLQHIPDAGDLWELMKHDKKNSGDAVIPALLNAIGQPETGIRCNPEDFKTACLAYKNMR